jgi:hypothetical protein
LRQRHERGAIAVMARRRLNYDSDGNLVVVATLRISYAVDRASTRPRR